MKRVIIAVAIIVIAVGFSVWADAETDKALGEVLFALENDPQNVYSLWQEKKAFLYVFLMHDDIDTIDGEMGIMKKYAQADRHQEVGDCCVRIESYIDSVIQGERLSFSNVF